MLHRYAFLTVILLLPVASVAETKGADPKVSANSTLMEGDFGKEPTYIKSDSLTLKSEERVFVYTGNVEVKQGDMTLTSDNLEGTYDKDNKIEKLTAFSNVVIIKGEDMRATSEKAIYEAKSETVVLTENPELQQNGSVLTADLIRIFLKENRSAAEGSVRVKLVKKEDGEKGDLSSLVKGK